jgi:asparagine synthase (glutamine-hydrolysing)
MCGIVGIISVDDDDPNPMLLRRMADAIVHRGPDGEGYYVEPGVGLGHRRLSIIDLAGGQQPISNETGSVRIVFNGEIYNYKQLHAELEKRGHHFTTLTDTEVIVHAYEEYGERCVQHLRGMFAFALWDRTKQRLFLARDRVGIKPLHYFFDGKRLLFASELKALLVHPDFPRQLDSTALADYLVFGFIPLHRSIFQGVRKLLPAHHLVADRRGQNGKMEVTIAQYWDLTFSPEPNLSEADWLEGMREVLQESVRLHLMSDVPLGAFLSGGLDSSCVVANMAEVSDRPVKTFSIGFAEEDFSELPYARQVADRYATEHHEFLVRPDAIALLPLLAGQFDEPFGDSSAIPTYLVSKLAREHVTVALSGDGGDEIFAGYQRYANTLAMLRLQRCVSFIPQPLRKRVFAVLADSMPRGIRGHGTVRRLGLSPHETYIDVAYFHKKGFLLGLLHPDAAENRTADAGSDSFSDYFRQVAANDNLTRMQYLDTKTYLPEDILTKVDRASMLVSLETRVPLLDHKVLEFAARIPANLKFRDGEGKYIFKKYLRSFLPENLLTRRKMGFAVPLIHWFRTSMEDYTRDILFSRRCMERGFFNHRYIDRMLLDHKSRSLDRSQEIWSLLMFEHWCQYYLDNGGKLPSRSQSHHGILR